MIKQFRGNTEYKKEFTKAVDELIALNIEDRQVRIKEIDKLCTEYVEEVGEQPESYQLTRLANEILKEELTDKNTYKMSHGEYSILSERQLERRNDITTLVPDMYTGKEDIVLGNKKIYVENDDGSFTIKKRKIYDYMIKNN